MRWKKLGLIYAPDGSRWWAKSYATIPTAEVVGEDAIRVYFAALDENKYGRIGMVEVAASDPRRILAASAEPLLDIGPLGAFDDCGVNASSVINVAGEKRLYYIGWQRCERAPYMLFIGLAVSRDGGQTFQKHSRVPLLDRTDAEPFLRSAPCVIADDGGWKMWYVNSLKWSVDEVGVRYNTVIRQATSADGLAWQTRPEVCIRPTGTDFGVGRPWVIKEQGMYRMWYSIRSRVEPYRIGYAESADGIVWQRRDAEAGIARSETGWDSEMVCYPCVVDAGDRRYLFYNGNRHGSTGFGCAVLEE